MNYFLKPLETSEYLDNYLTALFYKGVIHRLLSQYMEAKECLKTVFEEYVYINVNHLNLFFNQLSYLFLKGGPIWSGVLNTPSICNGVRISGTGAQ